MDLLIQPQDEPNCLVYSAAMIMGCEPDEILRYIGHHGQEVWWPEAKGNAKFRGVHIQEIVDFALETGWSITPIDLYPMSAPLGFEKSARKLWLEDECRTRFITWLQFFPAILIHPSHATAWDVVTKKVFDPNGLIREIEHLQIIEAWVFQKSNQSGKFKLEF